MKGDVVLHSADTYVEQMKFEGWVIPSFAARRDRIEQQLAGEAARIGAMPSCPTNCWTR